MARLPSLNEYIWLKAASAAIKKPPTIFPIYTIIQFLIIPLAVAFFDKTGIVIRQFPVKSSAPPTSTIKRPIGNTTELITLALDGSAAQLDAIWLPRPPSAIKEPARMASIKVCKNFPSVFPFPTTSYFAAISAGDFIIIFLQKNFSS